MKFIFADSLDYVDPRYNFTTDRSPPDREPYWDDVFPHELLGYAPYDGLLVSRAIVGGYQGSGKYSESQAMRFRRVGAREFLRFREGDYPGSLMFGDCGAYSYHMLEKPPYTTEEIVDFYGDGRFTHGCSIDHVIFDFVEDGDESLEDARLEKNPPQVRDPRWQMRKTSLSKARGLATALHQWEWSRGGRRLRWPQRRSVSRIWATPTLPSAAWFRCGRLKS